MDSRDGRIADLEKDSGKKIKHCCGHPDKLLAQRPTRRGHEIIKVNGLWVLPCIKE